MNVYSNIIQNKQKLGNNPNVYQLVNLQSYCIHTMDHYWYTQWHGWSQKQYSTRKKPNTKGYVTAQLHLCDSPENDYSDGYQRGMGMKEENWLQRDTRDLKRGAEMFYVLIMTAVPWLYTFVQTH